MILRSIRWIATALVVLCGLLGNQLAAEERQVFSLAVTSMPFSSPETNQQWYHPDLLCAELYRQALLVSAREMFGLATRDGMLREPMLEDADVAELQVSRLRSESGDRFEYKLLVGDRTVVAGGHTVETNDERSVYLAVAEVVEQLSRGEFADALKELGYQRVERTARAELNELPEEIAVPLRQMDILHQYRAVREAHAAVVKEGDSQIVTGALARAYANLGQLTGYCLWNARHAFGARALVYATRLIHRNRDHPVGYWHRAYALTLLGLPQGSLWDLAQAEKVIANNGLAVDKPEWLALIEAANHYDFRGLQQAAAAAGPHEQLAPFLWFRSVEFCGSTFLTIDTAKQVVERIPHCMRIYSGMNRAAGVSYRHYTTTLAGEQFGAFLRRELTATGDAIPAVSEAVEGQLDSVETPVGRAGIAAALVGRAGVRRDLDEPSVAILGTLIDEVNVLQISERAYFLIDVLAVDAEAERYVREILPAIRNHPLGILVETCRFRARGTTPEYQRLIDQWEPCDVNSLTANHLFVRLPRTIRFQTASRDELASRAYHGTSEVELDFMAKIDFPAPSERLRFARQMERLNPYSPKRFAHLIRYDWENVSGSADQWAKDYGHHPAVAIALANRYERDKRYDEARVLYEQCIKTAADGATYRRLIRFHFKHGDRPRALELAEQFLGEEDFGLEHAELSMQIACTFMNEREYGSALPWAERSAASGAAFGLNTLQHCYEGLRRLDDAEQLAKMADQRYSGCEWHEFVVRTGHGDLEAAYQARSEYFRQMSRSDDWGETLQLAAQGKWEEALTTLHEVHQAGTNPLHGLIAAAIADRLGKGNVRDEALKKVTKRDKSLYVGRIWRIPKFIEFGKVMQKSHASGDLDREGLTALRIAANRPEAADIYFLLASYYEAKGESEKALNRYQRSARFLQGPSAQLSWIRLRELGHDALDLPPQYYDAFVSPK